MASGVLSFSPVVVRAEINPSADRKPDQARRTKWWSPIFGFPSDPEYLNPEGKKRDAAEDSRPERNRFAPGAFTEEKARQLRRMSGGASSVHESMYHSAIASRLASDFSDRTAEV